MIITSSTAPASESAMQAPMGHPWPGPAAVLPLVACIAGSLAGLTGPNISRYPIAILDLSGPMQEDCRVKNDL